VNTPEEGGSACSKKRTRGKTRLGDSLEALKLHLKKGGERGKDVGWWGKEAIKTTPQRFKKPPPLKHSRRGGKDRGTMKRQLPPAYKNRKRVDGFGHGGPT